MAEWRLVGRIVADREPLLLGGLDPWQHAWSPVEAPAVIVPHPQYPAQRHKMWIYEIASGDVVVRFAAGEFSNGAWGFYLPA
jgi:hypothetical protein